MFPKPLMTSRLIERLSEAFYTAAGSFFSAFTYVRVSAESPVENARLCLWSEAGTSAYNFSKFRC